MSRQWDETTGLALASGDSVHGQILELLDDHNRPRDSFTLVEPPNANEIEGTLPQRWSKPRAEIRDAVDVINASRADLKKWIDGADLDDDLEQTLKSDAAGIVTAMCETLGSARQYYRAAGGYPNDLTFTLVSDKGNPPCTNVPMSRPYATTMIKRTLVTIAETSNEAPDANNEQAFLDDHTGFVVPAGQSVEVIGYRRVDQAAETMCQIHGGGGTGWLPCADVARQPQRSDGCERLSVAPR